MKDLFFHMDANKGMRTAAVAVQVLLVFAVLLPSFFVAVEAGHDCQGDGCQVCVCIQFAQQVAHEVACGTSAVSIAFAAAFTVIIISIKRALALMMTLVKQKVRINI